MFQHVCAIQSHRTFCFFPIQVRHKIKTYNLQKNVATYFSTDFFYLPSYFLKKKRMRIIKKIKYKKIQSTLNYAYEFDFYT